MMGKCTLKTVPDYAPRHARPITSHQLKRKPPHHALP